VNSAEAGAQSTISARAASLDRYWNSNIRIMVVLLMIWAAAGLGCGVLIADWLNLFTIPGTGFPLGFWFAQQASIAVFVLLILVYCILMNRLDRKHHRELVALDAGVSLPVESAPEMDTP
jgi:putative solute:sodium symporter small subunit